MNNKRKVTLLLLLVGAMLIALVGCKVMDDQQREDRIKELLRDKYGEEFEIREMQVTEAVHAWCYPLDDTALLFEIDTSLEMNQIAMDDYLQCLVERQLNNELQPLSESAFGKSLLSTDIPLASTENYVDPNSETVTMESLLEYIKSEELSDRFFIYVFSTNEKGDVQKEYDFICDIGKKYNEDDALEAILVLYYGDEQFLTDAEKALNMYGWSIATGSSSREDIMNVIKGQKSIVVHFDDGQPYIIEKEGTEKLKLTEEKFLQLRVEVCK